MIRDFWLVAAPLLGLVIGSFLGALSYRLPRGQSVAHGRSKCPSCETPLTSADLIPVLSWLIARGRCRHCGEAVSARYPVIETSTAVTFFTIAWVVSDPVALAPALIAAAAALLAVIVYVEARQIVWSAIILASVSALSAAALLAQ